VFPLPNPQPPPPAIPSGTLLSVVEDRFHSSLVRLGFGYAPTDGLGLYADGEFYHVESDGGGTFDVARGLLGIEFQPHQCWTLRAGVSLDQFGFLTLSAGAGANLTDKIQLEFAYQHNAFPEVNREFGTSELVGLSGVVLF
jgi:opacity protein-like surface antigen